MTEEILVKLNELLERFREKKALESQIDNLRKYFVKMLQTQYPLLYEEDGSRRRPRSLYWDDSVVEDELQILVRSAIKGSDILHVDAYSPSNRVRYFPTILSPKYGLKVSKVHSSYPLLSPIRTKSFGLIDKQNQFKVWNDANLKDNEEPDLVIDFGPLLSEKRIIQAKFLRFLELFQEAISLKLFYQDLSMQERFQEMLELCDVCEYSGLEAFEELYNNWDKLCRLYLDFSSGLEKFKKMETSLIEKLREENRNFRIMQKIRNSD